MNDAPGIRSDNQGVAKLVAAAGIMGAAINKPIQKVLKDKAKQRANEYNKAAAAAAAKKAAKPTTKKTTPKPTVVKPPTGPKTSSGKISRTSSRPTRPRTLANRAKTPRGK